MRNPITLTIDSTILDAAAEKSRALNVEISAYVERLLAVDLEASDYITTPIIYIADDSVADINAPFILDRLPNESDAEYAEREHAYKLMCKS
jgi:hypothetical protein